jgi:hypothetical protein
MFSEVKVFRVKPDRVDDFNELIGKMKLFQANCEGCLTIKYQTRNYVFDHIDSPPRPIKRVLKCVSYYSFWEFETIEQYAVAQSLFFSQFEAQIRRHLIAPFDIHCGESL